MARLAVTTGCCLLHVLPKYCTNEDIIFSEPLHVSDRFARRLALAVPSRSRQAFLRPIVGLDVENANKIRDACSSLLGEGTERGVLVCVATLLGNTRMIRPIRGSCEANGN